MLMYSPLLGLREVSNYPRKVYQGLYVRGINPNGTWSVSVLRKNSYGRNIDVHWVDVPTDKLPAKLKVEALIQGIPC